MRRVCRIATLLVPGTVLCMTLVCGPAHASRRDWQAHRDSIKAHSDSVRAFRDPGKAHRDSARAVLEARIEALRQQVRAPWESLLDNTLRPVDPRALAAFESLQTESQNEWTAEWSPRTGRALQLVCKEGHPGRGRTLLEKAQNFIEDYSDLLWVDDAWWCIPTPEFRLERQYGGRIVFAHYSEDLKVYGSRITIIFNVSGVAAMTTILSTVERVERIGTIPRTPKLTAKQAINGVDGLHTDWPEARVTHAVPLQIFPSTPPCLIYNGGRYGSDILIDAMTGEVVFRARPNIVP